MSRIITRFAPSPTGMLHIGGARTALFNYLFAKKHGGDFMLRIEDTDSARSTDEAKDAIIRGMKWLGLDWDGEIVYQSARCSRHREVAELMVASGAAYYAYDNQEELDVAREEAAQNNRIYRYNPIWRNAKSFPEGIKPAIRLRVPEGRVGWQDLVKGDMSFDCSEIDDPVLLRSDGTPTYMLAVVCDDIDMGVTHVIRGDDHVSNTPKQILIYRAIGTGEPGFGHIPLIHDINGQKLSKRKGAVAVCDYEQMGYLPEALCNYLMRLGWSDPALDERLVSLADAASIFEISEVGVSPSRFDFDKLNFINLQYLQSKTDQEIVEMVVKYSPKALDEEEVGAVGVVASEIKKSHTVKEVVGLALLFAKGKIERDQEAIDAISQNPTIKDRLLGFMEGLDDVDMFKERFDVFLKESSLRFGAAGPVLRSILIGKKSSLALTIIVKALGKKRCLERFLDLEK